jgi:SPP1 gp7 family putative phage head morphogenesis protein
LAYTARFEAIIRNDVLPVLPGLLRESGVRLDDWADRLAPIFTTVRLKVGNLFEDFDAEREARIAAEDISDFNRGEILDQMRAVLGVDVFLNEPKLNTALNAFAKTNAALIKSIPEQELGKIEQIAMNSIRSSRRPEDIAAEIVDRFGVAESRARLIALDQSGKLNGQLTQLRQTELGIGKYIWRGVLDERERESHVEMEGAICSWDTPPEPLGLHVGQDYACRCNAEPILPADLFGGE